MPSPSPLQMSRRLTSGGQTAGRNSQSGSLRALGTTAQTSRRRRIWTRGYCSTGTFSNPVPESWQKMCDLLLHTSCLQLCVLVCWTWIGLLDLLHFSLQVPQQEESRPPPQALDRGLPLRQVGALQERSPVFGPLHRGLLRPLQRGAGEEAQGQSRALLIRLSKVCKNVVLNVKLFFLV